MITPNHDDSNERMVMLAKLDESVEFKDKTLRLSTNDFGDAIDPEGYRLIASFKKDVFPEWTFENNGFLLRKTIAMIHGENTIVIIYEALKSSKPFSLQLQPLIAARNYHKLQHKGSNLWWDAHFEDGIFQNKAFDQSPTLYIKVPGSQYHHNPNWFDHFQYQIEKERGLDYREDLMNHGTISVPMKKGDTIGVIVSIDDSKHADALQLFQQEKSRREKLLPPKTTNQAKKQLYLAADQFLIKKQNQYTIIAGYHWFTDWCRDAMIALPGLCLVTNRHGEAKGIFRQFAKHISEGMLPNSFQDNGNGPTYNHVDGSLWFFVALHHYAVATNDQVFITQEMLPVLEEIVAWHFKGTRHGIIVDNDGLLWSGEHGHQLTWMDAKVSDWVITPRSGKPVEVQALWYNALLILSNFLKSKGDTVAADKYSLDAQKAKESFASKFWYEKGQYLYDVIEANGEADASLRPNQVFAITLPFPLIEGAKAKSIFNIIEEKLFTPVGLRTLAPTDLRYVEKYEGGVTKRDSAYHQGTAWPWLLGAYIDAIMITKGTKGKSMAKTIFNEVSNHLEEGCIGTLPEIFDGSSPQLPKGCIAQAWTVGELLRVMHTYKLY